MLGNYGEIFLVDWGMAQELKPGEKAQRLGTPAYFAPEVVNKEPISAAVDVFALGGALYRILVGFAPYERAQSLLDAMRRAKRCDFPPIPESAPHDLRALAEKALARNPNNRFADAGEFADALERVRRRAPILARRENAENSLEELKHTFEQIDGDRQASAKQKRKRRARLADALVGNVNEFALARRAFIDLAKKEEERDDDNEQPDDKRPNDDARRAENALLRADFARAEIDARKYQLKQSLALGDFSQASALVDALRDLQTQEFALAAPDTETLFSEEYRSQSQNAVEEFDRAAQRGLAERRRAAALKTVSAALLLAVGVMLAWNLKTAKEKNAALAEKNDALAEKNNAQTQYLREQASNIFNVRDAAAKQAIRDRAPQLAIVEYFQAAQSISDEHPATKDMARHARALMETTAQTSLLLQREAAFTPNTRQTSFSRNGDAFAILDNLGNLIAWNADDLTSFAWKRVDNPDNLHLRANPLYKSRDAATPKEAAPFLTVNSRGAVRLFGDKTNSY
ncbi:MAG: protein kinase, partial [Thermoguttaceae bacterium]|nr:protein kinase [Thermoguttaceae bacterium]